MDRLYEVTAVVGKTIAEDSPLYVPDNKNLNVAPFTHNEDILLWFAGLVADFHGLSSTNVSTKDHSTLRTEVKNAPSFLDNLSMFWEALNTGAVSKVDVASMRWKPRERFSITGYVIPDAEYTNHSIRDFYDVGLPAIANLWVDLYDHPDGYLLTPELFFDFARRFAGVYRDEEVELLIIPYDFGYHQLGNSIELKYTFNEVSERVIAYDLEVRFLYYPNSSSWTGAGYRTSVTYRLLDGYPTTLQAVVAEGLGYWFENPDGVWTDVWYNNPAYYRPNMVWQPAVNTKQTATFLPTEQSDYFIDFYRQNQVGIRTCFPALYHTQSRAYQSLTQNVSRNFESFMESPGFLPVLVDVVKDSASFGGEVFGDIPVIDRLRTATKLLLGLYIAYIFAVRPALESVRDIFLTFIGAINETKGEASLIFQGDASSFINLPDGLRNLLATIRFTGEPQRYKIVFRSQMKIVVKRTRALEVIDALLSEASRYGIELDPSYIWAAQPFSFVVDWFVPIGGLLRDAFQRYKLIGTRNVTVGHSVSLSLTDGVGNTYNIFIRSDATDLFIDPPSDSWLTSHGAPQQIAVPLAIMLMI